MKNRSQISKSQSFPSIKRNASTCSSVEEQTKGALELLDHLQRRKIQIKNDLYKYVNLLPATYARKFEIEDIYINQEKSKVPLKRGLKQKNAELIKKGLSGRVTYEKASYYTEGNEIMTCQQFIENYATLKKLADFRRRKLAPKKTTLI